MANELDLNNALGKRATITIEPEESQEEHTALITSEARQDTVDMVKSCVLFFLVVTAIIIVGGLCSYEGIFDATATSDTKRWAQTTLSALFTGSLSFVLGQMTARKAR